MVLQGKHVNKSLLDMYLKYHRQNAGFCRRKRRQIDRHRGAAPQGNSQTLTMNVLVYSGPEVLQTSLKQTLSTLRSVVVPHYTVQAISAESLASHPWSTNCALLVFPDCHELSPPPFTSIIREYVENGGAFLALPTGASYPPLSRALDLGSLSVSGGPEDPATTSCEMGRLNAMREILHDLGLQIPSKNDVNPSHPLPQFLIATPDKPDIVSQVMEALSGSMKPLEDKNDTFHFRNLSDGNGLLRVAQSDASSSQPKYIIVCRDGKLPSSQQTPLFNLVEYFSELLIARENHCLHKNDLWAIGEIVFYGEVVTSTQTMFDKYVLVWLR
jgi:hypothetical protein